MELITNGNGWVIAADDALLETMGVPDIETLHRRIVEGSVTLPSGELWNHNDTVYRCETTKLHSVLGTWYQTRLIALTEDEQSTKIETTADEAPHFDLVEEPEISVETKEEPLATKKLQDDLLDLGLENVTPTKEPSPEPEASEPTPSPEENFVDLLLPIEGEERVDTVQSEERADTTKPVGVPVTAPDATPSKPFDPQANAQEIGVSLDDYRHFVDEYIQTAETMKDELVSSDEAQRKQAIERLRHLAGVLRLEEALSLLDALRFDQSESMVATFLQTLKAYGSTSASVQPIASPKAQEQETESRTRESQKPGEPTAYRYDPIDLSDVKPIRFDFTVEEAANDLSLPKELIEEFIMDFIKQAHEETERMIEAYRKGDLETVQKIGHLLKGTSSNLRITPLADTLYEIQFNEDIERVPELVRNYWGHFLSLENQMKLLAK